MDTLCGLGLPEIIIIALLAFVVVGPERSRDTALMAGRFLRNVMKSEWWRDLTQVVGSLRNLPTTLVRMAELEEAQKELRQTVQDINSSARLDRVPPEPPKAPPDQLQPSDPWGISQAAAGTTFSPPKPPSSPAESEARSDS